MLQEGNGQTARFRDVQDTHEADRTEGVIDSVQGTNAIVVLGSGQRIQLNIEKFGGVVSREGQLKKGMKILFHNGMWRVAGSDDMVRSSREEHTAPSLKFLTKMALLEDAKSPSLRRYPRHGSGIFHITKISTETVSAREDRIHPTVDIPMRRVYSQDNEPIPTDKLQEGMRLSLDSGGYFVLADKLESMKSRVVEERPGCLLPMEAMEIVLSSQSAESLNELKGFAANKYSGVYWNRMGRYTQSLAGYLMQCVIFEEITRMQARAAGKEANAGPISVTFGLQDYLEGLETTVVLGSPQFEEVHRDKIDHMAKLVERLLPEDGNGDFAKIAGFMKLCVTVITPRKQGPFEISSHFPEDAKPDDSWQQVTFIGVSPFPVLIPKKIAPFLAHPTPAQQLSTELSSFIYKPQKFAPPQLDPAAVVALAETAAYNSDLKELTLAFLGFAESLVGRFDTMVERGELRKDYASTEIGDDLGRLWEDLKKYSEGEREEDSITAAETNRLVALLSNESWTQFCSPCDISECPHKRDILLPCRHSLCAEHFSECVAEAEAKNEAIIRIGSEETIVQCKCYAAVSATTLKAYDKELFARLLKESESRLGLFTCHSCLAVTSKKVLIHLPCNHCLCPTCTARLSQCPDCSAQLTGLAAWLESMTVTCDSCDSVFAATQVSAGRCANYHVLCARCLLFSCKRGKCVTRECEVSLSEEQIQLMSQQATGMCGYCTTMKMRNHLLPTSCDCVTCFPCALVQARNTGVADCCWKCKHPFQIEISQQIRNAAGLDAVEACFLCRAKIPYPEIELVCGEVVHGQCLFDYAKRTLTSHDSLQRILCSCGIEIYAGQIPNLWDREHLPATVSSFLQSNPTNYSVYCSRCGPNETVEFNSSLAIPSISNCGGCSHNYCVLCLQEWDEQFHQRGICSMVENRENIKKIEKKRKIAVQCPYCKTVQEQGKVWQQCTVCQRYFCCACVARHDVIEYHGGSYHRPECEYRTAEFNSAFDEKCSMCKIQGGDTACDFPKRLARRGQFNPSELSFH